MTIDVIRRPRVSLPDVPSNNDRVSPRLPVKRSLFGKVDDEECKKFFDKQMDAIHEKVSKKWNFDFVNDQPLQSGPFEWTPVQSETVPQAYRLSCTNLVKRKVHNSRQSEQRTKVTINEPKLTQRTIDGKFVYYKYWNRRYSFVRVCFHIRNRW